jgi:hypothetical protein
VFLTNLEGKVGKVGSVVDPDPDPELFEGSGSGINSFGSGSDQAQFGMNLIPNFSVKINVFSTECGKKSTLL